METEEHQFELSATDQTNELIREGTGMLMSMGRFRSFANLSVSAATGLVLALTGCGGGGAAVDVGNPTGPGAAPEAPAIPGVPSSQVVTTLGTTFTPPSISVSEGASVTWQIAGNTHNVTFVTGKPTGGDIGNTAPGNSVTRTFSTAGTYSYECTLHSKMAGSVVVTSGGASPVTPPPPPPPASPGSIVQATPSAFTPERLEIAPGGTVTWEFSGGVLGVVFEDAAPAGGNIPDSGPGTRVSRTFTAVGDYDYYSSKNRDLTGRIRVR